MQIDNGASCDGETKASATVAVCLGGGAGAEERFEQVLQVFFGDPGTAVGYVDVQRMIAGRQCNFDIGLGRSVPHGIADRLLCDAKQVRRCVRAKRRGAARSYRRS